jgi:DNA-binding NarL/FixJ family response regulator
MLEVFVVDDHPLIRMCLQMLLDSTPGTQFAGEAETGVKGVE